MAAAGGEEGILCAVSQPPAHPDIPVPVRTEIDSWKVPVIFGQAGVNVAVICNRSENEDIFCAWIFQTKNNHHGYSEVTFLT